MVRAYPIFEIESEKYCNVFECLFVCLDNVCTLVEPSPPVHAVDVVAEVALVPKTINP